MLIENHYLKYLVMLNQRAKNNRSFFYKFLKHNINLYFATKSLHQITLKLVVLFPKRVIIYVIKLRRIHMTTGQRLAKLRKDHKYTQEKLGEILEVTRQSISKWESDQAFPKT